MANELIRDVHLARHAWAAALDQPFNEITLMAIKARYEAALRQDATYRALYAEQTAAYQAEVQALRAAMEQELKPLRKAVLAHRAGHPANTRLTRAELIDGLVFAATGAIEGDHPRVRRIWDALTQEQKEGVAPR